MKNSLARRATEGTVLAPAFEGVEGSAAVVWGAEDIVSLAKVVSKVLDDKQFEQFVAQGRRHGRLEAVGRRHQEGQQVAEPRRAAQHPGGSDPVAGRHAQRAAARARAPSWRARSRRRAKKAKAEGQIPNFEFDRE